MTNFAMETISALSRYNYTVDDILSTNSTDLFLAGHSHNGNIRIPYFNTGIFKYQGARKYNNEYFFTFI